VTRAYLCLGGNVGVVADTLALALEHLSAAGVRVGARSSLYRTPPWGPVAQPDYVNQVVEVFTDLPPPALLRLALEVERKLGRNRSREERFGPRRIDIDLLLHGDTAWADEDLILPHPRLAERAFALVPLLEIAPDARIGDLSARDALATLDTSGIERLD